MGSSRSTASSGRTPPNNIEENGATLVVVGVINFNHPVAGDNVYIQLS